VSSSCASRPRRGTAESRTTSRSGSRRFSESTTSASCSACTGFQIASIRTRCGRPTWRSSATSASPRSRDAAIRGLAPDLIVEVLSPDDRPGEILATIGEWLDAGVRLVWVLHPDACQARVYRPDGSLHLLGATDELDGEDVLPGFRCSVA
jgi:hypothetical protein